MRELVLSAAAVTLSLLAAVQSVAAQSSDEASVQDLSASC